MALGTMSVVSPITACSALVPFVLSLATGERPATIAAIGAILALSGAILASLEERKSSSPERARAVLLAVVSAVAIGLFVYFVGLGSREGDVLSTLVGARIGSLGVLVVLLVVGSRSPRAHPAGVAPGSRGRRPRRRVRERAVRVRERPRPALARLGARLAVSGGDAAPGVRRSSTSA